MQKPKCVANPCSRRIVAETLDLGPGTGYVAADCRTGMSKKGKGQRVNDLEVLFRPVAIWQPTRPSRYRLRRARFFRRFGFLYSHRNALRTNLANCRSSRKNSFRRTSNTTDSRFTFWQSKNGRQTASTRNGTSSGEPGVVNRIVWWGGNNSGDRHGHMKVGTSCSSTTGARKSPTCMSSG